jgi:tetratricopeptide (TPR) repeat protein
MQQVIEVLDDAAASGIVEQLSPPFGRLRFSHGLIRETLYEGICSARRQLLHRNIGEILETLCAGDLERHVSELAHHFCQAAPAGVAEKAVDYAVRAGQRAMRLLAYEEAVGHFELALQTLHLVEEPRDDLRCELLLGLGTAQGVAGDRTRSQETFIRAADAARATGDPQRLAEAALGLGRQSPFDEAFEAPRKSHHPLVQLLEEALAALPAEDTPLRARLLSRLANSVFWKPDSDERRRLLVREAVAMAERLGDSGALAEALSNKRIALMGPGGAEERLADSTRVLRLAAETGDEERELQARKARLYDLLELSAAASADVEIERIEELARALRQPRYLADAEMIRAMRALMDGKLDEGGELARRALRLNQQVRPEIAVTLYGGQMFRTVWREKGQLAELEKGVKAVLDQVGPMPGTSCALAFVRSEQGKREEARAEFERMAADGFANIPCEVAWTAVMANLTEVCCFLDDRPRARVLYGELLPFAAMNVVLGPVPFACWGPIAHFLGMLAATMGEKNAAAEHFECALEAETQMRMPATRARTQYEYGRMLVRSGSPDAKRGAELLAAALETARSLRMTVLEEKVAVLLAESPDQTADARAEAPPQSTPNVFRREGEYWTIAYEGRALRLRDTKGVAYLAELLRNPGREMFALDLARVGEAHVGGNSRRSEAGSAVPGDPGDAGRLLDGQAKAAYRRRLDGLHDEVDEAERSNDPERAGKAREKIGFLTEEVARAIGLGGRDRDAASVVERARASVTIAIRATLRRISENHPALGRHLAASVKTGRFCAYTPDPRSASSWSVETAI